MDKTAKERMKRYRERRNETVTESPGSVTVSPESVTLMEGVTKENVTLLRALADPVKRKKLEMISESLRNHKVSEKVYLGYPGLGGIPFDMIGELLEVTR